MLSPAHSICWTENFSGECRIVAASDKSSETWIIFLVDKWAVFDSCKRYEYLKHTDSLLATLVNISVV